MAGLLTATAIWKNFILDKNVNGTILKTEVVGEYEISEINVDGREIDGEHVKIFCKLIKLQRTKHAPVIIICEDAFRNDGESLAKFLAKKGFICFICDYSGEMDGKEKFTSYPEKVSYANVKNSDLDLFEIKEDYITSNWFEWDCAVKCALYYVQSQPYTNGVGFLGVNDGATVAMHVASTEENVGACVIVGGIGWQAYRDIDKYGDTPEPHFTDETLRYVASVESESYSKWIKCPLLSLMPTNSEKYDSDRAYDTVSRIDESVYTAFNLSPLRREVVDYQSYIDAELFLSKFLLSKNKSTVLPNEVIVKAEIVDKKIYISVTPDLNNLKDVELYVSEEVLDSSARSWKKRSDLVSNKDGNFVFSYKPYGKSKRVFCFARATYKNKFTISSPISVIKFDEKDVIFKNKSVILYSSRTKDAETSFAPYNEINGSSLGFSLSEEDVVTVKESVCDTVGLYSKNGLISFRLSATKYAPKDDAILMFDAISEDTINLKIALHVKNGKGKQIYFANVKVISGVWQNVKLFKNNFKTLEGAPIREFSNVYAISFESENQENGFLINNALWV